MILLAWASISLLAALLFGAMFARGKGRPGVRSTPPRLAQLIPGSDEYIGVDTRPTAEVVDELRALMTAPLPWAPESGRGEAPTVPPTRAEAAGVAAFEAAQRTGTWADRTLAGITAKKR